MLPSSEDRSRLKQLMRNFRLQLCVSTSLTRKVDSSTRINNPLYPCRIHTPPYGINYLLKELMSIIILVFIMSRGKNFFSDKYVNNLILSSPLLSFIIYFISQPDFAIIHYLSIYQYKLIWLYQWPV